VGVDQGDVGSFRLALRGAGDLPRDDGALTLWFRSAPERDRGRAWKELLGGAEGVVLPIPTRARGDAALESWSRTWTSDGSLPWRSVDLASDGVRWRLVVLDVLDGGPEGSEQAFWLPDAVAHDDYDHLLVFSNLPMTGSAAGPRGRALYESLVARTAADRILLIAFPAPASSGARLTAGPWGELTLEVGRADGGAGIVSLRQDPPLLDGFVRAVAGTADDGVPPAALPGAAFAGHWEIAVDGRALDVFWRGQGSYHLRWARERGWLVAE
jgi:hypothetical protein